jgi:hypothetical protein
LNQSIPDNNQIMGDLERKILQQTQGLERKLLEEATQKKADQSPPICPVFDNKLSPLTQGHERTYQTRIGLRNDPAQPPSRCVFCVRENPVQISALRKFKETQRCADG